MDSVGEDARWKSMQKPMMSDHAANMELESTANPTGPDHSWSRHWSEKSRNDVLQQSNRSRTMSAPQGKDAGDCQSDDSPSQWQGMDGLKNFSKETTCHGVQYLWDGSLLLRAFWALAVAAAFGGFFYFFVKNVTRYTSWPKNSVVETIQVDSLPYPAITICNLNTFEKNKTLKDPLRRESINAYLCKEYGLRANCFFNATVDMLIQRENASMETLYAELGQSGASLVPDLQFLLYQAAFKVDRRNLTAVVTNNGLCHTINADGKAIARNIGVFGGIRVILGIDQDQYYESTSLSAGVKVILHDPGQPVLPIQQGFAIGAGQEAFVAMRVQRVGSQDY